MRDGTLRLGYVETTQADPLRAAAIGLTPLISGAAVLDWIGLRVLELDRLALNLLQAAWPDRLRLAGEALGPRELQLLFYPLVAVGNSRMPSPADRTAWLPAVGRVAVAAGIALGLDIGPAVWNRAAEWMLRAARTLAGAFPLAAAIDLILIVPLTILVRGLGWLTG